MLRPSQAVMSVKRKLYLEDYDFLGAHLSGLVRMFALPLPALWYTCTVHCKNKTRKAIHAHDVNKNLALKRTL